MREAIRAEQPTTLSNGAQLIVKLEHRNTHFAEQLGVVLDEEQLRAFDVAFEQVDRAALRDSSSLRSRPATQHQTTRLSAPPTYSTGSGRFFRGSPS